MSIFADYSRCYDLLYADKDYAAETAYVARHIRKVSPEAISILELGCGTGRHARYFASHGFNVHGVDLSPEMIEVGRSSQQPADQGVVFEVGDVRSVRLGRRFDCVLSLFHVMSYQTSNEDIRNAFRTAAEHTAPGGVFVFDCWYGPGVLTDPPAVRVKRVSSELLNVIRIAEPVVDSVANVVQVNYSMHVQEKTLPGERWISESHRMRYFFVPEIELMLGDVGYRLQGVYRWMSDECPTLGTWNAMFVAGK
jgi:SAM-dependent methyltransferase